MQNRTLTINALVVAFLVVATLPAAAETVINFDDVPGPGNGYYVGNFYASSGVSVGAKILTWPERAHSNPNVALDFGGEFCTAPLFVFFLSDQSSVSLYGGAEAYTTSAPCTGTLTAFDSQNQWLADAGPFTFACGNPLIPFSITRPQADIAHVRFFVQRTPIDNVCEVIDDLTFLGDPPPPLPTTPPQITIDAPQAVDDFLTGALSVSGTISGLRLNQYVTVVVEETDQAAHRPGDPWPYYQAKIVPLPDNGTCDPGRLCFIDGPVSFSVGVEPAGVLPLGLYKVTVTATNVADLEGTATLNFENRSAVINALNPGPIIQGRRSTNCQIGFYQDGSAWVLFTDGSHGPLGLTQLAPAVANKWLDARATYLGGDRTLGCPTTDSLAGIADSTWKIQEFERGRIATAGSGEATAETHFMPKVFADLADYLGSNSGEADWALQLGVPMEDPSSSWSAENPTRVFQRFLRPTDHEGLQGSTAPANTLEIRGRDADLRLYIERVGGDLNDLKEAMDDHKPWVQWNTPTIWESLPCSGAPGPYICPIVAPNSIDELGPDTPPPPPLLRPYAEGEGTGKGVVPEVGNHVRDDLLMPYYCTEGKYGLYNLSLEWATTYVAPDPAAFLPVDMKVIVKAHDKDYQGSTGTFMSPEDNPLAHEHKDCGCGMDSDFNLFCEAEQLFEWGLSATGDWLCDNVWVAFLAPGIGLPLLAWEAAANDCQTENICPSDWNLHTRPLPRYWNHFAGNYPKADFEIEWEWYWGQYVWPTDWFKSMWANYDYFDSMEMGSSFTFQVGDMVHVNGRHIIDCGHEPYFSEIHPPNTIVDIRRQHNSNLAGVATRAQIWINGFYRSTGPGVTIWAPPRPDPDASLGVWHPRERDVAYNIKSKYSYLPEGVQVKFISGTRYDEVTQIGQQIYPADKDHGTALPAMTLEHCDAENGWVCKGLVGDNVCDNDPHGTCSYPGEFLREYAGLWKVWWEIPYGH